MRIFGLNRRIIRVLLGSQYAHMLEYRAEIALWALSGVLPFIMLSVWSGSESAYRLPPDRILSLHPTLHATMPLELWTGGFYFSRTRVLGTKRPARPKPTTSRHML